VLKASGAAKNEQREAFAFVRDRGPVVLWGLGIFPLSLGSEMFLTVHFT
jgi:hypothetical protein